MNRDTIFELIPELKNKRAITHSGRFHADDVFSAALLKYIKPDIEIIRASKVPENFNGLAFDIGLGDYDHHQNKKDRRTNGIEYASFGKLWSVIGPILIGSKNAKEFDAKFVQYIDDNDTTGTFDTMSNAISYMMPPSSSTEEEVNNSFFKAVDFAYEILKSRIVQIKETDELKNLVFKTYQKAKDKKILEFDFYVPVGELADKKTFFIIFKSDRGYCAMAINNKQGYLKIKFPAEWYFINNAKPICPSATYCQRGGKLLFAEKKTDLISACEYLLNKKKPNKTDYCKGVM